MGLPAKRACVSFLAKMSSFSHANYLLFCFTKEKSQGNSNAATSASGCQWRRWRRVLVEIVWRRWRRIAPCEASGSWTNDQASKGASESRTQGVLCQRTYLSGVDAFVGDAGRSFDCHSSVCGGPKSFFSNLWNYLVAGGHCLYCLCHVPM